MQIKECNLLYHLAQPSRSPQGKANQKRLFFFGNASHQNVQFVRKFYSTLGANQVNQQTDICVREPPLCGGSSSHLIFMVCAMSE